MKYLIVNADDFGLSPGTNRGIIEAHEKGIVTSTSLMVRWPAAIEAAAYARGHSRLGVGLHIDLGEWIFRNSWEVLYEVAPVDDPSAVRDELDRQLRAFRSLMGRDPSHLDSHQHVHRKEPVRSLVAKAARELSIPVRHFSPRIKYCGDFYGQTTEGSPLPEAITAEKLSAILREIPEGTTELCCHPGDGSGLNTMYASERALELKSLCDPSIRQEIQSLGITLVSFAGLKNIGEPARS